jgi:glycosyltransferase involved in cell wall biosynthesis
MKQNDCVISFMYDINFFTLIAGLGLHKEVIISERGNPEVDDKRRWVHYGRKWLYPLASKVVFQTRMAMEFFSPKIREKSAIIPNPINSLPDWHHGEKEKTIVAIGRLVPQKNFTLLLDAFNDFHKNHPEYNLTIFGEGNLRPQLEQQVVENKLDGVVSLPGFADDIYAKIKTAGIYVSCSNYEGISNAMMEALAMGIPSVCTDCPVGGAALVINDGINGLLIPVNDKKALVTALNQIADDKEFAKKLCRNALQVRVDYSLEKIGNEWKRLIERKMVKKNLAYSYNEK